MALQTRTYSQTNNTYTLQLTLTENSVNPSGNTSNISFVLKLKSAGKNFYSFNAGAKVSLNGKVVGSRSRPNDPQIGLNTYSEITLVSGSTNVTHNSNGTLNMSIVFKLDMSSNASYSPTYGKGDVWTVSGNSMTLTNIYTVSASVSPSGAGSVSGTGKFQSGKSCTLKATPGTNYVFVNWTKNGSQISTQSSYTFNVVSSATYIANFKLKQATFNSAPNFTDEDSPKITFTNPGGNSQIYAYIEIPGGSSKPVPERQITGTSYTFNFTEEEKQALRKININSNTSTVRFGLRTVIDGINYYDQEDKTLTIKNPEPIFNPAPLVEDINNLTLALTNDKDTLIENYSNVGITFNAEAVKYANLVSKKVTNGEKVLTQDGTIENVINNVFNFSITDSRKNTTTRQVVKKFVGYIKPTCVFNNTIPDGEGNFNLSVFGDCFTNTFGEKGYLNQLTVEYRYRIKNREWETDTYTQITNITKANNKYEAKADISGLSYQETYEFEIRVYDSLQDPITVSKQFKAIPVFDWSEKDFNFNVPIVAQDTLDVKKGIFVNGVNLIDILYPVGSIYTSVNSTNPANIFGGEWTQITGRFLYCSTTSKQTGGSNTINLAHTHTTAGHKLTVSEIPSHRHSEDTSAIRWSSPNGNCELVYSGNDVGSGSYGGGTKYTGYTGSGASHSHGNTGSALSSSVNNMPAYFTVYCWYRIK